MLIRATTAIFVDSHLVRVTLCVHASRCVPDSYSRATSGAPQKTPMTPGIAITRTPSQIRRSRWWWAKRLMVVPEQSPLAAHGAITVS